MIRGVIFDLGNTLMYFDGDWDDVIGRGVESLYRFLSQAGVPVSTEFGASFLRCRRQGRERSAACHVEYTAEQALREALMLNGISDVPRDTISRALEIYFAPEEEHWVAYPDALVTVRELARRGLRLGLVSNATDRRFLERIVKRAELKHLLAPIVCTAAVPWRKPDPRVFKYVLDEWGLPPQDVVMVGDWPSTDIVGAHRAGMPAILIEDRWKDSTQLEIELTKHRGEESGDEKSLTPEAIIQNLSELPAILDTWSRAPL